MKKKNELFINKLLQDQRFLVNLCNYSNNDIEQVTKNLAKLVGYYVTFPDCEYPTNLDKLFKVIANSPQIENYHIIPYNGIYTKTLKHLGLVPELYYKDSTLFWLNSLLTYQPSLERLVVYDNVEEALANGFTSPQVLYKEILKQPKNQEKQFSVGISEYDYCSDILNTRLNNTQYRNLKEIKTLAKKVLKKYIDRGVALCFIKESTPKNPISAKDILTVTLPSRHQLLNICALNQNYKIGSKYPEVKREEPQEYPKYSGLTYSRIERIPVDDTFTYVNSELTGDVSYDIDTVYGRLDYKRTKEKLSTNPNENIARIKDLNDINLIRRQGKYQIENGRHRIVYLKNYYEKNKDYYEKMGKLDELKQYLTIPVNVEVTIEDEKINDLLLSLERVRSKIKFLKVDINNDDPELVIIDQGNAYHVTGKRDILELSKYLLSNQIDNRFYIGTMPKHKKDYLQLFYHLTANLKEEFFNMNFIEIINYLKTHQVIIGEKVYEGDKLDYITLHACYTELNHRVTIGRIRNDEENIIKAAEEAEVSIKIGNLLTSVFANKPELILLDPTAITNLVKTQSQFADYPELLIKRCVENNEYRTRRIYNMLQETQYSKRKLNGR